LHQPARFRELRKQQAVMSSKRADGRTPRTAIRATLQQANIFSNPGKPILEATLDLPGPTFIIKENHGIRRSRPRGEFAVPFRRS
jgi:hypothetical protein